MVSFGDLKTFVDLAVDYAKDKAEGLITLGKLTSESQIRFSQNSIDISKRWETMTLEIVLILEGNRVGITGRSVAKEDDVRGFIDTAVDMTRILPESMFFAGVEDEVHEYAPIMGNYDEKIDDFTERAPEVLNSAIDEALQAGAKRTAGALKFGSKHTFMRSSYGPEGESKSTDFDLNIRAFQDELDYSGQGLHCGTIPSKAEKEMIEAGSHAGELSAKARGADQGEPGKYDLVLSPTVAADIIAGVPGSANPFMVLIGLSPLGDRIGESIAPEFVTARDNPSLTGAIGSRSYDAEGTPARVTTIVDRGVLKSFIHNTSTARMYESESTGNSELVNISEGSKMLLPANSNIEFAAGDCTLEELLENHRPTIYVTCNWYTRFQNYQTGDFSTIPRDAMFLIENGEMKPIKNLRISDNCMRMLANISALGKEIKQVKWWEVPVPTFIPAMRISDCRMTAATQ